MLILTRKAGQSILIGDNVTVEVLRVRGGQVRIGVRADKRVRVLREEIAGHGRSPSPPVLP